MTDPDTPDAASHPLDVDMSRRAQRARRVLSAGALCFAALIATAAAFEIREVAVARGQTVPLTTPISVEHLEGGRIDALFVRDGDVVHPGTVLLRLGQVETGADLAQVESRHASLVLQRARLTALLAGREPDFTGTKPRFQQFVSEQRRLYLAQKAAHAAALAATSAQIIELEAESLAAATERRSALSRVEIAGSQVAMRQELFDRGHSSRTLLLDANSRLERARSELAEADRELAAARRARAQADRQAKQLQADAIQGWTKESAEIAHEIAILDEQIKQASARFERAMVVAPVKGVIHELSAKGRGEVLVPGETIAQIVPIDGGLIAEVRADPADIGHIQVGDPAVLAVDTFDREGFGELAGEVESISATTFETPQEELYYKVRLRIAESAGREGQQLGALLPGMTLEARILTGSKTILRYLAKPFLSPLERAFSER